MNPFLNRILFHARMVGLFLTDRDAYDEARMMDDHANWHYGRVEELNRITEIPEKAKSEA